MQDLDNIYKRLLSIGLIHTKDLLSEGRAIEAKLELNHLYAIPQLLGSSSPHQHRFYLNELRAKFVDEAHAIGAERLVQHIDKHYVPIWAELKAVVAQQFDPAAE